MKKMAKAAAIAAMVLSVALTGCNGKKGEAASQSTEASAKSDSAAVSRKQIDAFLKDYEKLVKKAEDAAKKGKRSSLEALEKEANKLGEKFEAFSDASESEWEVSDSMKILTLGARYSDAMSKLSD